MASEYSAADRNTSADATDANQWLDEHGDALYRYARARVGQRELAEDLVQETFLAAVQSRQPFRRESTVRTWLVAILRRKIVDHFRQQAVTNAGECSSSGEEGRIFAQNGHWQAMPARWKSPAEALECREFWTVLEGCLSKLPASLANAFILKEVDNVPVNTLSETLELSAGNIRVRLYRARHYLRECLQRNWFGKDHNERARSS